MGILTSLDAVRDSDRIVEAMRRADDLAFEANREPGLRTLRLLTGAVHGDDQVVAIAGVHALGQVVDDDADRVLTGLLSEEQGFLREHAAWVLGARIPHVDAIGRLIGMVVGGGFGGMIAQRSLEQWAVTAPEHVAVGLEGALLGVHEPAARYRLVETLGLIRGSGPTRRLLAAAGDTGEGSLVRTAAVAALGQRRGDDRVAELLDGLARGEEQLSDVAQLALIDLSGGAIRTPRTDGPLTVAQLFLHADIDAHLSAAGSGDNGGVATLLVRLGDALVEGGRGGNPVDAHADGFSASAGIGRVITLSRGSVPDAIASVADIAGTTSGHHYGRIPLLTPTASSATAWPQRVAARRGIRRMLRAAGGVDVLHLRMAEVGSLAASDVARELDLPVVFTVAPDPHAVIQSMDAAGSLTRESFGAVDEVEHYWFRARLVQRLASNANRTVLFPRPELRRDMRELLGIDIDAHPERHSVVPEGIDLQVVDRAVAEATAGDGHGHALGPELAELHALVGTIPPERRGLPLLVSVGRFHRVKGMAAIVAAWQRGSAADRANLLLVGGDLEHPSADEREQIDAIDRVVPADDRAARGLLMPGHRPNDTVARWVAAARTGLPGANAASGVYVCGSVKEEFGIALLEAMATGLLVVAPDGGGPATYVEDGVTGFLTRTWDPSALTETIDRALDAADAEVDPVSEGTPTTGSGAAPTPRAFTAAGAARAARSRAVVERDFTIQAMATALREVYGEVRRESVDAAALWPVSAA
ncbi:glycosyltransferase [Herbiconiux sp. CPCC 203407]|uniref:Glycosyltransferase n=1 Tax=Herbiconiux oxytropis TaxID=2970915 RepID=A0AA41XCM3_9MICO|nr:glycosyltransferase [Herbiconiux oxytropis]MCS5722187.1 glycosyltransferase [Herbiconiux oxytropis]MCS5725769.1 glycosyltransferase [Herbiconiux oxytropis]